MKKGFSLIELVIVIGLIGLVSAVIALSFSNFRRNQALQYSTDGVVVFLNEARSRTLSASGGNRYSIRFESDRAVLFSGTTYTTNASTNEYFYYTSPVTLETLTLQGGGSDISFNKLNGGTDHYGTIQLGITGNGSRTITVSATGAISRN